MSKIVYENDEIKTIQQNIKTQVIQILQSENSYIQNIEYIPVTDENQDYQEIIIKVIMVDGSSL